MDGSALNMIDQLIQGNNSLKEQNGKLCKNYEELNKKISKEMGELSEKVEEKITHLEELIGSSSKNVGLFQAIDHHFTELIGS